MVFIQTGIIIGIIGAVLGGLLGIADRFLRVEQDPRLDKVIDLLPGYNCGACGYPGCQGMAEGILEGGAKLKQCTPAKPDQLTAIKEYLENTPGPDGDIIVPKM